jgi:hypothetical protein
VAWHIGRFGGLHHPRYDHRRHDRRRRQLLLQVVEGAVENTHYSSCARRRSNGGEGGIGDVRVVYLVEILVDLVLDGVKWRKI